MAAPASATEQRIVVVALRHRREMPDASGRYAWHPQPKGHKDDYGRNGSGQRRQVSRISPEGGGG